jgi:hypothetical protein
MINYKNFLKLIKEHKDYYDYYDILNNSVYDMLSEFLSAKRQAITKQKFNLIPFEQYRNCLIEFVRYGELIRFPKKYIFKWADLCVKNIAKLYAGTELYGHYQTFPYDEFCDIFFYDDEDKKELYYDNILNCLKYLTDIEFYDWCVLPDGTSCMSDYGLDPLLKLLPELEDAETAEQKLVVINKILDISHQNGDLTSLFLEGGRKNLNKISGL